MVAIPTGLGWGAIRSALGDVPREVWYAIAAFAVWWFGSAHYISEGREEVKAELREAQAKAEKLAKEARDAADAAKADREAQNAKVMADQIKAIEKAEANDENALDAIF